MSTVGRRGASTNRPRGNLAVHEILLRSPTITMSVRDRPSMEMTSAPAARTATDAISFVEIGRFTVSPAADVAWSFAPGMLFAAPRGLAFACRRDAAHPADRCLSVEYAPEAIEELRAAGLPPLRAAAVRATPRQRFLRHRLRALAAASRGDITDTDAAFALQLLAGALFESVAVGTPPRERGTPTPSLLLMRRIARAAELIESEYHRNLTLAELAAAAGMSQFHFARSFARLVGMPPHRYLVRIRLRAAARRLAQGANVTSTCYAVGFSSPSHFAVAFRRRFGVAPSALRRGERSPLPPRATPAALGRRDHDRSPR